MNLSLAKLPWYGQVGAFVALAAAALGVFFFFYVSPANLELAERQKKLDTLRMDINKGLTTARKLPEFRQQVAELEGRLEGLKSVLPEEKDLADLLRRLHTLAMQANLKIDEFKPATTPNNKLLHAEWPIELQLEGNYHNLALFFDRIGKFARIININSLEIKARDKQDPALTITAQCTATTFVLLDAKTAAAQQAAADKAAKKAPGS
jgi:type IV pilus assembly protein PilO